MNIPHLYSIAFALAVAMISYDEIKNCGDLPWPPRIISAGILFAVLDLFSFISGNLTAVMAIGIVLAILLCTIEGELVKRGKIQKLPAPCSLTLTGCQKRDCGSAQPSAFDQFNQSNAAPNLPPGLSVTGPTTPV